MNEEFEKVPCLICGIFESDLLFSSNKGENKDNHVSLYVSICPECGLVYLNPRWKKDKYLEFYSTQYDDYYRNAIFKNGTEKMRYTITELVWKRISNYVTDKVGSVLDIGCGMGWFLKYIHELDSNVSITGIETSDYCVDNLINNVGARVLSQDIDSDWHIGNKGKFDLIIMRHVLEHFLNPIKVLEKVNHVLAEDGILYIAVPDMMNPKGSLYNYWFRVVHAYYFSKTTLIKVLDIADFRPIKINSNNSEIWGVFKKGSKLKNYNSNYIKQMKIIDDYQG
ncbi:hypothetical protein U472_03490 [Orenia metallireducens]|uniref:Methyltransferase domain-containing protein n=1 Tax=Orenia metallireducens TaxID=1413210 RepID=A0A1C0AB79_9FIRM|nr:class I SAM-dependent methyltransferase [Orenia metallireducens]OCL27627.1 hypothetical protein U472_03490 [Orenia metallireducens]